MNEVVKDSYIRIHTNKCNCLFISGESGGAREGQLQQRDAVHRYAGPVQLLAGALHQLHGAAAVHQPRGEAGGGRGQGQRQADGAVRVSR